MPDARIPRLELLAPRWRKVLRDVWSHRARTLLVVLAIVVGIVDARQAPAWREIAAERRREAEERARKRVH